MRFEKAFKLDPRRRADRSGERGGPSHAEEDRLRLLEMRGGSSITAAPGGAGSLQNMTGRDIDLTYGADGETLEHARITGSGVIRVAGEAQQASRRISAETFDVPLGAAGTRPTALTARGRVELELPAEKGTAGEDDYGGQRSTARATRPMA